MAFLQFVAQRFERYGHFNYPAVVVVGNFWIPFVVPVGSKLLAVGDKSLPLHAVGAKGKVEAVEFISERVNIDGKYVGRTPREVAFQRRNDVFAWLMTNGTDVQKIVVKKCSYFGWESRAWGIVGKKLPKVIGHGGVLPIGFIYVAVEHNFTFGFLNIYSIIFFVYPFVLSVRPTKKNEEGDK